jgi:hypothetical protein
MAITKALVAVGSLTAGQYVFAFLPNDGAPGRSFDSLGSGNANLYPSVVTTPVQVTQVDGAFGGDGATHGGPYPVHLQPASTDTVNASSPIHLLVPPQAEFIVVT